MVVIPMDHLLLYMYDPGSSVIGGADPDRR